MSKSDISERSSTLRPVSRLENGSSSKRIEGWGARALVRATRCCWPPESDDGSRSASSDNALAFDARIIGVIAAGLALWKRLPFVFVVVFAAFATAMFRLLVA